MSHQAPEQQPVIDVDAAMAMAIRLHRSGQWEEAEIFYQGILEYAPDFPEALHFLGMLKHQQGNSQQGIALIEQALALAPNYVDAHSNLGNILHELGHLEAAAACYQRAVQLNPEHAGAFNNLGVLFNHLGRYDEALQAFATASRLLPDRADIYQNLGNVYLKQGQFAQAIEAHRRVVSLRPYHQDHYERLCRAMYLHGEFDQAVALVQEWLQQDPDNPLAQHHLQAYTGELSVPRASDAYITQVFDNFADSFDQVLQRLDYQAPSLIADAVQAIQRQAGKALHILDAGCGTGLCGPLLHAYASRLDGVDLSANMLAGAEKRGCYQALHQAELTAFIAAHVDTWELIVSADTLVYFGDLQPVLAAAQRALTAGGHLVFTVERLQTGEPDGFKIHPHGRFSHCADYLQEVLAQVGFRAHTIDAVVLRNEGGKPVAGWLVVASA